MPRPLGDLRIKCSICDTRLARYATGLCFPCHTRTAAEGTRKTRRKLILQKWRDQAKRYNKLAKAGMTQQQIADVLGCKVSWLKRQVYKWKKEGGIAVVSLGRGASKIPTKQVRTYVKGGHGSTKWGKRNCFCDPCVTRRKQTRAEHYARTGN